jgi:hypothetical protein
MDAWQPLDEVSGAAVLNVRTDRPAREAAAVVEVWLT